MSVDFFEEEQASNTDVAQKDTAGGMVGFITNKLSVSKKSALRILFGIAVLFFILSGILFAMTFFEIPVERVNSGFDEDMLRDLHQEEVLRRENELN